MDTEHAPATSRSLAADSLGEFESGLDYADDVLSRNLSTSSFRGSDRALTADLFWGSIRWRGRLDAVIAPIFRGDYRRANPNMRILLRMGAYQLFCQDRIPDHAAVSQTVEIAIQRYGRKAGGLTNAILRRLTRERERWETPPEGADEVATLAFFYSHPRWLVDELVKRFGADEAKRALELNNTRAPLTIFVNGEDMESASRALIAELDEVSIAYVESELLPGYFRLETHAIGQLQHLLDDGVITVQDESAGLCVALLAPEAGERILDACAAPGGKLLAISRRMRGTSEVIGLDISPERIVRLQENIERARLSNVTIRCADARAFQAELFDRVLCDAPCSATGLLRKQPDVRWRRKSHHIAQQHTSQMEILNHTAELVKPGGILVYSTCSILPAENHDIVAAFLKTHGNFFKEDARGFLPDHVVSEQGDLETFTHIHGTDGAYACRFRRTP